MGHPDGALTTPEAKFAPQIFRVSLLSLRRNDGAFMVYTLPQEHRWAQNRVDLPSVELLPGEKYGNAMIQYIQNNLKLFNHLSFPLGRLGIDRSIQFYPGKEPQYRDTKRVFFGGTAKGNLEDFLSQNPGYGWINEDEFRNIPSDQFRRQCIWKAIDHHIQRYKPLSAETIESLRLLGMRSIEIQSQTFNTTSYDPSIPEEEFGEVEKHR